MIRSVYSSSSLTSRPLDVDRVAPRAAGVRGAVLGALAALALAPGVGCGPASHPDHPTDPSKSDGAVAARPGDGGQGADDSAAHAPGRLGDDVAPTRYRLEVEVDPEQPLLLPSAESKPGEIRRVSGFTGRVVIDLAIARPVSEIWLHAEDVIVHRVALERDGDGDGDGDGSLALAPAHRHVAGGLLALALGRTVPAGPARLEIEFSARYGERVGAFRQREGGRHYVLTDFEPIDARRAFPCFDDPRFKAPWELSLIVPSRQRAFSNMPAERTERLDRDRVRISFAPTRPMPSYLVAFAVGPFEEVAADGGPVPVRILVPRGRRAWAYAARDYAPALLRAVAEFFAQPVPYPKIDIVSVPEFAGAMENPGLITIASHILLADPARPSLPQLQLLALVCAHEMAHLWLGDLVTLEYWHELWLNEGLASWLADEALAAWDRARPVAAEQAQARAEAVEADSFADARAVRQRLAGRSEFVGAFDAISYKKGAAIAAMLEHWLSPPVFRDALRRYVAAHADGNVTTSDLVAALVDAARAGAGRAGDAGAGSASAGPAASAVSIGPIVDSFTEQPGAPLVHAELSCRGGRGEIALSQQPYELLSVRSRPARTWAIPVCVRYPAPTAGRRGQRGPRTRPGESTIEQCVLLDAPRASVRLRADGCPAWVMPNAGGHGYYRYAMPAAQLTALAAAPLSRAEATDLAHDLRALVRGGYVRISDIMPAVSALAAGSARQSRHATLALAALLAEVDGHMLTPAERPGMARLVDRLFGSRTRALGLARRRGESVEDGLLRPELVRLVGRHGGDRALIADARALVRRWLTTGRGIDRDMIAAVLVVAAGPLSEDDDARLFDELERALLGERARSGSDSGRRERGAGTRAPVMAHVREVAAALGSFRRPALIERAHELLLAPGVSPAILQGIEFALLGDPTTRGDTLAFLTRARDELPRSTRTYLLAAPVFARAPCDPAEIAAARAVLDAAGVAGADAFVKGLRAAEHEARACDATRRDQAADAIRHFQGVPAPAP